MESELHTSRSNVRARFARVVVICGACALAACAAKIGVDALYMAVHDSRRGEWREQVLDTRKTERTARQERDFQVMITAQRDEVEYASSWSDADLKFASQQIDPRIANVSRWIGVPIRLDPREPASPFAWPILGTLLVGIAVTLGRLLGVACEQERMGASYARRVWRDRMLAFDPTVMLTLALGVPLLACVAAWVTTDRTYRLASGWDAQYLNPWWHVLMWPTVVVLASRLPLARDGSRGASEPELRCLKCGYDLAGLSAQTCPECGRTFATPVFGKARRLQRLLLTAAILIAGFVVLRGILAIPSKHMGNPSLLDPQATLPQKLAAWTAMYPVAPPP